jgi:hypothetical protein
MFIAVSTSLPSGHYWRELRRGGRVGEDVEKQITGRQS